MGLKGKSAFFLNIGFWTVVGAFQASNWIFSPIAEIFPYPWRLLATAFINAILWALITPPIFRLCSRTNPIEEIRIAHIAALLAVGIGITLVMSFLASFTHYSLLPRPWEKDPIDLWDYLGSLRKFVPQQAGTFCVVVAAGIASDSVRRNRLREREAIELRALQADLHAQLSEARLTALQTRLNPHFLFNTLNAVSALVATDPRGVRSMLALLSELLRHALKDSPSHEIRLSEELRLVRLYLEILEIRYQGQLETTVSVDSEVEGAVVPNMILQPLVENAMKHGLDRFGGHGRIEVKAQREGERLILTVFNTGSLEEDNRSGTVRGVGLELTRARLSELYGVKQSFHLQSRSEGGVVARIEIPFQAIGALPGRAGGVG